jgi:phosphate:Na+ symporter
MLYGLHSMGAAMKPLGEGDVVASRIRGLENPVLGALFGAVATALIQSSSGMMGITIKLASAGKMTLPAGIAVMLGAEIGTCLDTLVASVGRSRDAVRAGVCHLVFNVVTVAAGLIPYRQIAAAATWLPGHSVAQHIVRAGFDVLIPSNGLELPAHTQPDAA